MQPLKGLVIVMGILIALGLTVVGYTIVKRSSEGEAPRRGHIAAERAPSVAAASVPSPYGPLTLALPAGARILHVTPAGRRLVVELELAGGGERILVIELETGALLGSIDLKPQP